MNEINVDICSIKIPRPKARGIQGDFLIRKSFLEKIIKTIAKKENLKGNYQVGVVLTNDYLMQKLNFKYRKMHKTTDVLAFHMIENANRKIISQNLSKTNYPKLLGEIIISVPQAKRQAKSVKHSLKTELTLLLIHGFLHLLGYKDKTQADFKKIKEKQERYLYQILKLKEKH